ncbi:hypothetical protein ACR6C2_13120 [Streptomyces sp. INA 01156]
MGAASSSPNRRCSPGGPPTSRTSPHARAARTKWCASGCSWGASAATATGVPARRTSTSRAPSSTHRRARAAVSATAARDGRLREEEAAEGVLEPASGRERP